MKNPDSIVPFFFLYLVVPSIGLKLLVDVGLLTNVEAIFIEAVIIVTWMNFLRDKRTK